MRRSAEPGLGHPRRAGRPRLRRLLWRWLHRLPEFELALDTKHGRLRVSNKDAGVGRILFLQREYELATIRKSVALLTQLEQGPLHSRLMIDAGANIGTVCISMVRSAAFAGALAFEPEPRNYALLVKNVLGNGLGQSIRCFNAALSSSNSVGEMELSKNSGDHRLRAGVPLDPQARYREGSRTTIPVTVRRLDDMLAEAGVEAHDVALLWMDVQGAEKHVLEGAGRLVEAGVPVVAEFWPYGLSRAGVSPPAYAQYMAAQFTRFYDLSDETPAPQPCASIEKLFDVYAQFKQFTDLLLLPRRSGR
ncbi:MAG TPA: FkbM family methyltransferase [Methylomirabilota bacterium]|nr:FkbM family methyltransferase [Methylomirabilota bacterium]